MEKPSIALATDLERDWAALMLVSSEPWITLGTTLEQCSKACWDPEYLVYISHLNDEPCGTIILHPRGVASSPYVKSIAVAKEYRSNRIGEALMEFSEDLFRSKSKHMFLCVSSFNTGAQKFYERMGYSIVGEFKDYVIEGASELLMHKRL